MGGGRYRKDRGRPAAAAVADLKRGRKSNLALPLRDRTGSADPLAPGAGRPT